MNSESQPPNTLKPITIYTDGGCNPNPGPGGWAAILLTSDQPPKELVGSEPETTNNQMELRAAIEALKALATPHQVEFHTDSQYLRRGITEWLPRWERQNWRTGQKTAVKNQALWQALAAQLGPHQITWRWTKGHAGDKWNERADELARSAIPRAGLPLADEEAVHIFAAAAYSGKTNIGGWSVLLRYQSNEKTLSGRAHGTSGNRMHLQAAIEGLQTLKRPLPIHLYTMSGYLKDGATMWLQGWQNRGWQTKEGKPVKNRDLWETLAALSQKYDIQWHVALKSELPPEMTRAKGLAVGASRSPG